MRLLSKVISVLFHPMLMPVFGVFLIFNSGHHVAFMPLEAKRVVYLMVGLTTCILPLSLLPLLYQFGAIKSFQMETPRERLWPVLFTALFYYMGYLLLKRMGLSGMLATFMLSTLATLLIALVITLFWKISLHTIGIAGVAGALAALGLRYGLDVSGWLALLVVAGGLTASARLALGAHTPAQVYAGYALGFLLVFFSLLLFL